MAGAAILTGALSVNSCHRRPLEDPDNLVVVKAVIDTKGISNVTCDIYNPEIEAPVIDPEMMRVLFYTSDGNSVSTDTYISSASYTDDGYKVLQGEVAISEGDYRVLVYNFDTESTLIRNSSEFSTVEAYTDNVNSAITKRFASKAAEIDIDKIVYEPDHLMVARNQKCNIPYHTGTYEVKLDATTVIDTYYLQIKIKGSAFISSASAVLTGLSSSNMIAANKRIEDPEAIVYFTLQPTTDPYDGEEAIACIFNTFGRIANYSNDLAVTFNINTTYGTVIQEEFPIADLFESDNGKNHHWLLLEHVIEIPDPGAQTTGGGWTPQVDDWESESYDFSL